MNNPINKKVKAFTISELLVVLVITSIIIGLSLTVLNLVQKQLEAIKKNYAKNTEVQLLERALINDVQNHNLAYDATKKMLVCTSEKDTVVYKFKENFVLRNSDTIGATIHRSTLYLEGNMVKEKKIDAIELILSKELPDKKLFIAKTKDATFYMNQHGI